MPKKIIVNTDGGARGNPGPAAIGFYIRDEEGNEIAKVGEKIGKATNNVAEYLAVIFALEWIVRNLETETLSIGFYLDSNLVVNQLNGIFKIKEGHLRELFFRIKILEQQIKGDISYHHISRKQNFVADSLVNSALDNPLS